MDAVGPIFSGNAQAQQYTDQAAQAAQQSKDVNIQSVEASGQRREALNASLSNIAASRAQGNLSADSPTGVAISSAVQAAGVRGQNIQRLGYLNQEQSLNNQASAYRRASSNAITGGYIDAYGKLEGDAMKVAGY